MEKWLLVLKKSRKNGTMAWIDHLLLWSLKKPFLPSCVQKAWAIELMKDLVLLNAANATSRVIPAGRGLFKQTELSEWDTVSRFACMDAARFSPCCSDDRDYYFTSQIINRAYLIREAYSAKYSAYTTSEQMAPSERSTFTTVRQFLESAKSVDTYLKKGESGICTTFAWAASYPLIDRIMKESRLSAESLLKRVEVVAYTNHIFVIVNRAGAKIARNVTLPSTAEWGADVFQVDTWLGSLGHPIIYKGIAAWNMPFLDSHQIAVRQ